MLTALAKLQNQISAAQSALFAKLPSPKSLLLYNDSVQAPDIPKKDYVRYDYTTAKKGGVKIGTGLAMNGEILNCKQSD